MINGYGPAFGYLGYQVHARRFFCALDRLESVALASTNTRAAEFEVSPQLASMLERGARMHRADPSIAIDYGNNFHRCGGDWRIGYTVFEYTRLAADWHHGLRQVDEVWTTSTWGRDVLLLNGFDPSRLAVVPEGFDPEVFHPGLKSRRSRDGTFRFLCVGKWEVRKGQRELLQAWARAFTPEAPVELVLLCDNPFVRGFDPQAEIARMALGPTAPIRVARPAPTDREMAQLYADADCFVLPTRAEGWGLPIMEAMACGTPVITTRYSAMTDYANDDNAYLLDVKRLVPVHDPLFFPQAGERGLWAEIDLDQLVALMRQVVEQREAAAARGRRAAADMLRAWTWDHAARIAHARLVQRREQLTALGWPSGGSIAPSHSTPPVVMVPAKPGARDVGMLTRTDQGLFLSDLEDQFVGRALRESGDYGTDEIDVADCFLRSSDRVLVIGAHIGTLVVALARRCREVIAFEANPLTFKLLQCNLLLNDATNVEAINRAASDRFERLRFVLSRHNSGGSKRFPLHPHPMYFADQPEVVEVDAVALDAFLGERRADLVVMDVEGSEYFVLRGMAMQLAGAQALLIEFIPHHLRNVAAVTPEQWVAEIAPYFDLLYVSELGAVVEQADFATTVRAMYDNEFAQEQIVFLKRAAFAALEQRRHPKQVGREGVQELIERAAAVRALSRVSLSALIGHIEELTEGGRLDTAIGLYRRWIDCAEDPAKFVAHFNLAHLLAQRNRLAEAEFAYRAALAEHPDFIQAGLNLGSVLERAGRPDEALALWQETLVRAEAASEPDPALRLHALNNLGRVFEQRHRYAEAESALARSLALKPDQDDVLHHWVHLRQKQCEWPVFSPLPGIDVATMRRAASALAMLSASGDPAEQLDTARRYALAKIPQDLPPLAPAEGYRHDRLRIGYLSSNLNLHAVTILTAEVYELHDRARVEVFGFCWSPEDSTPMRARVRGALDHLVRIDAMSDGEAAQAIRRAEIDVLIDLQGLTSGCRPVILAHRPAPVQVSWLGFPGTSAIPGVDYILADHYLIPEAERAHYSERPLYLPDCFQPNDRQRAIAPTPTRAACGLPEAALVLCAFNHNHKFNPEMFGVWMEILAGLPQAVLWLLADNEPARANLAAFAADRGIAAERLIFAPRVMPADYLARFQVADLFLDTLPFNGGTTASDALWAGLPVLTCSGRTFAGRMAGSLLHAVGLPELVTHSLAAYRDLALALGRDPARLAALRDRLAANRKSCPLFDTPRLVKALEDLLCQVAHHPPA